MCSIKFGWEAPEAMSHGPSIKEADASPAICDSRENVLLKFSEIKKASIIKEGRKSDPISSIGLTVAVLGLLLHAHSSWPAPYKTNLTIIFSILILLLFFISRKIVFLIKGDSKKGPFFFQIKKKDFPTIEEKMTELGIQIEDKRINK